MTRIFLNHIADIVEIEDAEHNYLANVLRAKVNDEVILFNNDGYDYTFKIIEITKRKTTLSYCSKVRNLTETKIDVTLFMPLLKGGKMDFIVQKSVELGVKTIVPLHTKNSQLKKDDVNIERLKKISCEACKQCGRSCTPNILPAADLDSVIRLFASFDLIVFAYEAEDKTDLKTLLKGSVAPQKIAVIIGSEGGFKQDEAEKISHSGVVPVCLGSRILRAETACVAVVSAVMYEFNEWVRI